MAEPTVELTDAPDEASLEAILEGLKAFNVSMIGPSGLRKLGVLIKDDDGVTIGGLTGHTTRDWLYVDMLFVPDNLRGQGMATNLLAMAEAEAVKRGCRAVWMDTVNPYALKLYLSLDYTICGELPDFARGLSCFFLQKRLDIAKAQNDPTRL